MTASDRLVRGVTRGVESQPEPPRPCPGMEAGGRWLPASSPRGRILTRGCRGRAEQQSTEQQRQPDPDPHPALAAAVTHWSCRSLSPLPPPTQPPPPPRCCSSCSGLLPPPLPRPLCPRAQPIPACRRGLLAQSPRSSRPPHCSAPGVMHCQSLCDAATPAFPVGPRRHRHGPS